jgi:hypothetical protein
MKTLQHASITFVSIFSLVACGGLVGGDDDVPDPTLGASANAAPMGPHGQPEPGDLDPPMLGVHYVRGEAGKVASSPPGNMTWHSGAILTDAVIAPIFWGQKWSDPTFAADKMTGLDDLYAGLDGSTYAATNTEYTGTNGQVGTSVTFQGHLVDPSATGIRSAPRTSAILAEVCKMIGSTAVPNGYYPVYVDSPRGSAGYCAWHSYGSCNGVPVQFGFFFTLDGDAGCDPKDTSGLHSQGLAALANVSGHEYSEAVTDPRNGGWYDSGGGENSDKCAWSWPDGAPTLLQLSNGTQWKIQSNWSNAAFDAKTGYANRSNQNGCLFTSP